MKPALLTDRSNVPPDRGLPADRLLLDEIASKWSIVVLGALCDSPLRFNELRRRLDSITQKALTQCLRRLERDGILLRRVLATSPVSVQYEISPLGRSLEAPIKALQAWSVQHRSEVELARSAYDNSQEQTMDGVRKHRSRPSAVECG